MSGVQRPLPVRRQLIEKAYVHAVDVLQPDRVVRRVLKSADGGFSVNEQVVAVPGQLVVIAIGKAAPAMASSVSHLLGSEIDSGIVLTKDGHLSNEPARFLGFEATHPVPDVRGIVATRTILDAVDNLTDQDVVLALISGGGSALLESPRDGLTLEDIQVVTDLLLRAGAPIQDLNGVRSELSQVKGGGLRRTIGHARTVSLILSDVLGNDPEVIASGPTIARESDPQRALDILDAYDLAQKVPASVMAALNRYVSNASDAVNAEGDIFEIIGDNAQFVDAVGSYLDNQGLMVHLLWSDEEGEARDRGAEWVRAAMDVDADVVIGGGEMTVTVRGDGVGGRNTEFALAAATELAILGEAMTIASLASDGQDGSADAAGGIVDETTVEELRRSDVDIDRALEENDSATALGVAGALVSPGPTGTNVNDVYIAIRG